MLMSQTAYQLLPIKAIQGEVRTYLEQLSEYNLCLDYMISLLGEVVSMVREKGPQLLMDNFRGEFGVFLECDIFHREDIALMLDNNTDHISSVAEAAVDLLDLLYRTLLPCLKDLACDNAHVSSYNFNFVRWVGDDILIATTYHQV